MLNMHSFLLLHHLYHTHALCIFLLFTSIFSELCGNCVHALSSEMCLTSVAAHAGSLDVMIVDSGRTSIKWTRIMSIKWTSIILFSGVSHSGVAMCQSKLTPFTFLILFSWSNWKWFIGASYCIDKKKKMLVFLNLSNITLQITIWVIFNPVTIMFPHF